MALLLEREREKEKEKKRGKTTFLDISVRDYSNDFYCSHNRIPKLDLHSRKSLIYSSCRAGGKIMQITRRRGKKKRKKESIRNGDRNKVDETKFR